MTASTSTSASTGARSASMTGAGSGTGAAAGAGRWVDPRQRMLALLAIGVIVGSFMPWIETALGTYRGFAGPGQYLFYAGVLGLAAGLVPVRSLAIIQGGLMAVLAIGLPLWQVGRLVSRVGFEAWAPGVGLVLVFGCGVLAARTTVQIARSTDD